MTSTVAGEAEPGTGDRARRWGTWDEFSHKRTAKWADSGRAPQGSSHWVQPVSPLPSFLQISSHWGLTLKAHVTPVVKLPWEECSRLPHVYLFNKLIKPLGESGLSCQPQLISRPSTNPFYPMRINAPAASGYGYGAGTRRGGEELWAGLPPWYCWHLFFPLTSTSLKSMTSSAMYISSWRKNRELLRPRTLHRLSTSSVSARPSSLVIDP